MEVGEYEDLEQIGAGAFGVTYRARHRGSGEVVALKKLEVRGLPEWKPVERFEREAKVLRALSHPGVVRFIEAFESDADGTTAFFIVSEFVEGPTLGEMIEVGHRWDDAAATQLLEALLETLEYLHGLSPKVVHRDIKPGNVVMTNGERPVLIDFGSVTDVAPKSDGGLTIAGTAGYMAPEQAMGSVDPRSDLYGAGATLVHALTHVHPSDLPRDGLSFDLSTRLGCSKVLQDVLERLLAPDPSARLQSAEDALAALRNEAPGERALATTTTNALVPATPRPVTPALRKCLTVQRAVASWSTSQRLQAVGLWLSGYAVTIGLATLLVPSFGTILGALLTPLIGLVFLLVTILGGRSMLKRGLLERYIHGALAEGKVEAITGSQGTHYVSYTYTVGDETHQGKLATNDLLAMRDLDRGGAVHVFHDPEAPAKHVAVLPRELERATEG